MPRHAREFQVGDEVYARPRDLRIGTFAENIAIDQHDVARKPASLSHVVLDSRGGENLERSLTVLKPGGQAIGVTGQARLRELASLYDAGHLRPPQGGTPALVATARRPTTRAREGRSRDCPG